MIDNNLNTFYPKSQSDWRNWLIKNHEKEQSVWLIFYKKKSSQPSISWSDAVDESLCFGWIDSKKKTIDESRYMQFYSKRKPKSTWSKINKEKIKKLTANGLMTKVGIESIKIAKQNGSWTYLDSVEALIVPEDLEVEFSKRPGSKEYYLSLSKSIKKQVLYWIISAKRKETRDRRILETGTLAAGNKLPKHIF